MPRGKRIDVAWLKEHYPTMTCIDQLLDDYEAEFGNRPTKTSVYVKANRLGIRKRPVEGRGNRCERPVCWSKEPEMEAWMLKHDEGQRSDVLSEAFRERFGFGLTRPQIDGFRASHGTGRRRRTSHGGGRPLLPVGSERASKDGVILVKVREQATVPMSKDNWVPKHVLAYEAAHGPLPEGHSIYFADGDRSNFDPANLVAVPRRLVGVLNSMRAQGITWCDAETLRSAMALAELRMARNDALAALQRTCPCCGKTFDNRSRRHRGNIGSTVCPECGAMGRKPPTSRRHRKYDHDEIRRLYAAGWRNEQIAAAVGCAPSTVSCVVHGKEGRRVPA